MTLRINGEPREVPEGMDVTGLLSELGLPAAASLVEHNGTALRREEWPGITLAGGDRIEIIRIVAGG